MRVEHKPGWHERGYLPHFDANTLLQHIVFCTAGSLPQILIERANSAPAELRLSLIDSALDTSQRGCVFSDPV
jgi:putative transposase